MPCPANTFNPTLGSFSACTPCPPGFGSGVGAAVCSPLVYNPSGVPLANSSLYCNASVALSSNVSQSRVIAFPSGSGVAEATPLVYLPASSPLNTFDQDVIVASPSACTAFSSIEGSHTCNTTRAFSLPSGVYYYLGAASALGMTGTPNCGA